MIRIPSALGPTQEDAIRRRAKSGAAETGRRGRILESLKQHGSQTARELTRALGGGPVAMRAHLRHLEAAGLVDHAEEHQRVGRPVRRFRLTPAADALFPKQYDLLAVRLIETALEVLGPESLGRILARWGRELDRHLAERLPASPAERLAALTAYLSQVGFMASTRDEAGETVLTERNCPIARVAARFPEICEQEAALYRRTLGRSVAITCCQARGDPVCTFKIGKRTD